MGGNAAERGDRSPSRQREVREESRRVQTPEDAVCVGDALDGALFRILTGGTDQVVHMIKNIAIIGGLFNLIAF